MSVGIRAKEALAVVRFRPFDTSTEQGRSKERSRRIALAAIASGIARLLSIGTALFTIPLTLNYLGAERYGLWMTISSFVALVTFADLGIGNGLLSVLSECDGRGDRESARKYVSSALALLLAAAAVILIAFYAAYPWIPWPRLFNVTGAAAAECGPAIAVAVTCSVIVVPLSIGQTIQNAYQDGFGASLWSCAASFLSLLGLLAAIRMDAGLVILALALSGAPLAAYLLNVVFVFGRRLSWLRPKVSDLTAGYGARVVKLGGALLLLHVCFTVAIASDNVVAAHVLGHEAVAQFSIVHRLFSIILTFAAIASQPFWPAYSEAAARGDIPWTRRTLRRSILLCLLLTAPVAALLAVSSGQIIRLWTGMEVAAPWQLTAGMALWSVISSLGAALAVFLKGLRIIRLQVVCAVAFVIGALIAKITFARWFGLPGIVWGNVTAYTAFIALPYLAILPRQLAIRAPASATN